MKRIKKISISNYRAFYGEGFDLQIDGKNVLIYGENGSGKSSLYRGMKDFFDASVYSSEVVLSNHRHLQAEEYADDRGKLTEVRITAEFGEPTETLSLSNTENTVKGTFVAKTQLLHSFLSYRELLQTHLIDKNADTFESKFSKLILETLLQDFQNPFTQNDLINDSNDMWVSINQIPDPSNPLLRKNVVTNYIEPYLGGLEAIIGQINEKLSPLLQVFTPNLGAELVLVAGKESLLNGIEPQIWLKVNYLDKDNFKFVETGGWQTFYDHLEILNEARLSALAISIYFAAILSYPTEGMEYKILFLDDIFIGLDMSNRLPLLEILKTEFADYQIFMTTYDRAWFETARQWFTKKAEREWKFFEMYVDDFTNGFDTPVILETQTHLKKAAHYLVKHDYPACGSYLRKACEELLEKLLKPHYYKAEIKESEEGFKTSAKRLNALVVGLEFFCKEEGLDYADFSDLGLYKDALLNPLSHNDIFNPIFKQELIAVLRVLKALEKITLQEIPNTQGKTPLFQFDADHSAEIQLKENILLLVANGQKRLLTKCKLQLKNIRKNGIDDTSKNALFDSLQSVYEFLCEEFGIAYDANELPQKLSFRGKTLQAMITEMP